MLGLSVEKVRQNSKEVILSLSSGKRYNICWLGYALKHPEKLKEHIENASKKQNG